MDSQEHSSAMGGRTMALFTAGTLLGIGVGMLVAPKRGSEMIQDMRSAGSKATGKMRMAAQNVKTGVRDAFRSPDEAAEDAARDIEAKV